MNAAERLFALMGRRPPRMYMSALGRHCWADVFYADFPLLGDTYTVCGAEDADHLGLCPTHRKEIIG